MKRFVTNLCIAASFTTVAFAQQKFEKIFYKDATVDGNDVIILADNAVSTAGETKFKLKITNKTADFIILKPEECTFMIGGKEVKATEKMLVISPNESDFRIINLKGNGYNAVKDYSFKVGGLYKVSVDGKVLPAPDFKLPASQNDFKAGDFSCTMTSLSKETDNTTVKFKCAYNGGKVGFINPTKAAVKMPDGSLRANEKTAGKGLLGKKTDIIMLMKGQDENITLEWGRMQGGKSTDMQKIEMIVIWRETFTEAIPVKLNAETLELKFDETKSK